MADSKLRIPRVALAVLVLGAACGDDEKGGEEPDDRDGGGHDHDAGDDHDAGGHGDHDAGAGDAGGDAGGGDTIDVSDTRIEKVARDFCAQGFACDVEEVVNNFDDEAACRADSIGYWEEYISILGEECIDAQLDLYACAALLSCDETVEDDCADLLDKTADACAE